MKENLNPEFTELHAAPPLAHDPLVREAIALMRDQIQLIEGGIAALESGCRYNANGFHVQDYFPNGETDFLVRFLEPLVRTFATKHFAQAKDIGGYGALLGAWIRKSCPMSSFAVAMNELYPSFTKMLGEATERRRMATAQDLQEASA
jgi:hypothetical protein